MPLPSNPSPTYRSLLLAATSLATSALLTVSGVQAAAADPVTPTPTSGSSAASTPASPGAKARALLGTPASGQPWHSGVWTGAPFTEAHAQQFEQFRGAPADLVTVYSATSSWDAIANNTWSMTVFGSRNLNYGLSLAPEGGDIAEVANGSRDAVFRSVGENLLKAGHTHPVVRIGWEANYEGWPWGRKDPSTYKAAFRHAASAVKSAAPDAVIVYGIGCGDGGRPQVADYYPGDDIVDVVECDTYDWWDTKGTQARTQLDKISTFARAHGKGVGLGEWGLVGGNNGSGPGGGDDPAFVRTVFEWLTANSDIAVYDCYFDERDDYIDASLLEGSYPNAEALYRQLF